MRTRIDRDDMMLEISIAWGVAGMGAEGFGAAQRDGAGYDLS
eukprot:COSAG01_NODE_2136_length_8334_cov_319.754706_8_plen_42_part_00